MRSHPTETNPLELMPRVSDLEPHMSENSFLRATSSALSLAVPLTERRSISQPRNAL